MIELTVPVDGRHREVLTSEALEFVATLHRTFGSHRNKLLALRTERQTRLNEGEALDYLSSTLNIRAGEWSVSPPPSDLTVRKVEITGPPDRKMMINALNSGASGFMADFEDSTSPTWDNMIDGQVNIRDAVRKVIEFEDPSGRKYLLNDNTAKLLVRPRGWHLEEKHLRIDGQRAIGALVDFGLFFFHNAQTLVEQGSGPYFYLPKTESHLEARLWNDIFVFSQELFGLPRGTSRATVLVEVLTSAFEMDEILYELRDHSLGLNAGRWDYLFSLIKQLRSQIDTPFPDRQQLTMTVPFMRAYTELLVKTCHSRGAFAMGGMAAFIPTRLDPVANETALERVREDKKREANDGFDGTWVAHPDLVSTAMSEFDRVLGARPNQIERRRDDVDVRATQLLDLHVPGGTITETGLRSNVNVTLQYLESWLRGQGAVALNNLMEDAATAEIARSQIWQWISCNAQMEDGNHITPQLVQQMQREELAKLGDSGRYAGAAALFEQIALSSEFVEFLTIPGYTQLP